MTAAAAASQGRPRNRASQGRRLAPYLHAVARWLDDHEPAIVAAATVAADDRGWPTGTLGEGRGGTPTLRIDGELVPATAVEIAALAEAPEVGRWHDAVRQVHIALVELTAAGAMFVAAPAVDVEARCVCCGRPEGSVGRLRVGLCDADRKAWGRARDADPTLTDSDRQRWIVTRRKALGLSPLEDETAPHGLGVDPETDRAVAAIAEAIGTMRHLHSRLGEVGTVGTDVTAGGEGCP